MELFIRVENGQPVDHPIADWNLKMFIEDLDCDNPPEDFIKFVRLPFPDVGPLERVETTYEIRDGVCYDCHNIIPLTDQEKLDKIEQYKQQPKPFDSWVFDETLLQWVAPLPYPTDTSNPYFWNENNLEWVNVNDYHIKGHLYDEQRNTWYPPGFVWDSVVEQYIPSIPYPESATQPYFWSIQDQNWTTDVQPLEWEKNS